MLPWLITRPPLSVTQLDEVQLPPNMTVPAESIVTESPRLSLTVIMGGVSADAGADPAIVKRKMAEKIVQRDFASVMVVPRTMPAGNQENNLQISDPHQLTLEM
jgi:hypothetical protein